MRLAQVQKIAAPRFHDAELQLPPRQLGFGIDRRVTDDNARPLWLNAAA